FGGRRVLRSAGGRARTEAQGETYAEIAEHGYRLTSDDNMATFAVDVDTAAYANVRRILREGRRPRADAVRLEELLNYFRYDDPEPTGPAPLAVTIEVASCPWNPAHRLARVGLKSSAIPAGNRQPANLVFLIDVSGSMDSARKLPLLKRAMHLLTQNLTGRDRVAIVVYAGAAGLVLPSTVCTDTVPVLEALAALEPRGSTAGEAGIRLAYQVAREHRIEDGINRIVLATDGDFNVGIRDQGELVALIEEEAASGISLTVLGFGTGNLNDALCEQLADHGDGNYAYVDSLAEARKVLVEELGSTLQTVARDVKLQVSFDPSRVAAHRLLGYENRRLTHRDFADDTQDAGEVGAGHGVTALFEWIPVGQELPTFDGSQIDPHAGLESWEGAGLVRVDVRYKDPAGGASRLLTRRAQDSGLDCEAASDDLRFAASVAWFAELLRGSSHVAGTTFSDARRLAASSLGADVGGHRAAFLELVDRARELAREARR
ncbi:MAG: VWA domain-containing protein, partial [Planctomycetota bacterium]